jgi:hypothetical protein
MLGFSIFFSEISFQKSILLLYLGGDYGPFLRKIFSNAPVLFFDSYRIWPGSKKHV